MVSCLEAHSRGERLRELAKNDFSEEKGVYNEDSPFALSPAHGGNGKGKGTHSPAHEDFLPDKEGLPNIIQYRNFDTSVESMPGNDDDIAQRGKLFAHRIYTNAMPYNPPVTVFDGQYINY